MDANKTWSKFQTIALMCAVFLPLIVLAGGCFGCLQISNYKPSVTVDK